MQAFSQLLDSLILTPGRNAKITLLCDYFARTPDPARGWALAAITGELELKSVRPSMIRALIEERMDAELFALSYDYVGDLAETVSLVWPGTHGANYSPPLNEIIDTLLDTPKDKIPTLVSHWMDRLTPTARWAFLKLATGGLRIGVSARLAKQALAKFGSVDVTGIEEIWHGLEPPYLDLFAWLEGNADKPAPDMSGAFRPVMLAHPLIAKKDRDNPDAVDPEMITAEAFAAEWKWDGIRVQAVSENGERRLYTRTGDDISHTFPDVVEAMDFDAVLDGELLVRRKDGGVAPFNDLQKRLNRKTVSKKLLTDSPAFIRAYDILQSGETDLRALSFKERRLKLETLFAASDTHRFDVSPLIPIESAQALEALRNAPPEPEIEGVMLKRWESVYEAGRPKGPWFKWKRDPFLIDAVIMYAQRGHGRRSGKFSDFTFGVWKEVDDGFEITPVGKAYFGFTDEKLAELDKFVRANTIDRFGPVSMVKATREEGLVVEVAFEGLQASPRHKSGVAMRFPRFNRIRWDKPAAEAETLDGLKVFLSESA
ncbi:cisplatin damage response ATP-dependent DNA ligase [Ponticaulis sp.]|uniref:cisplatin damage response ATP-dependent DNA ligase n=1 Tax=Ponticaulis sp. TaxID=2020902 RepID=UPI000B72D8EB|nr:cisplatin damage response ATP-dependent DNA ligase [Ponticaulis sp.]MAI90187.1 ATP-dependent DNA ligase [Ponticaulis sp.]OUX99836.1 MAG: ATP-dependent DNA ligase [Hyphomonadaceae bacterium TMED5]|tara:strand:- start:148783 stop:150411 length:1629 start_codon:yes stop_codon:yes gene_type:complete